VCQLPPAISPNGREGRKQALFFCQVRHRGEDVCDASAFLGWSLAPQINQRLTPQTFL